MNFQELPGVSFSLSFCGEEIPIRSDGRIEKRLCGGTSVSLETKVFKGWLKNWYPSTVEYSDGKHILTPSRSITTEEGITYLKSMPISRTKRNNSLVSYSQKNNIRMLFLGKDAIDIFTVALTIQNNVAWLTADMTYQAKINGDFIEYDPHRSWPSLFEWVSQIREKVFQTREVLPLPLPNPKSFADKTGSVIWWDSSMANAGSGCVMTNEGQVSAHWSNVERNDSSRRFLKIGELISFEAMRPRSGSSNFPHELVGIEPLY